MKNQTPTEKLIDEAVAKAKNELSGASISNCNFQMHMEADGATQLLAQALLAQAKANEATSDAMLQLAKTLKPIDACAIRFDENNGATFGSA